MIQGWKSSPSLPQYPLGYRSSRFNMGGGGGHQEMRIVGIMLEASTLIVEKENNDKARF